MVHVIYLNDKNFMNDRFRHKKDRRRIFQITTFKTSRISRNRVLVRDRGSRERELVRDRGSRNRVSLRDSVLFVMGRTIRRNTPIIIQLVISYFICLILTSIFLRYMFAL